MNDELRIRSEIESLKEALGFPGHNRICEERGCYNRTASGYILCLQCLYGTSERADDELVKKKKRLEALEFRLFNLTASIPPVTP